MPAEYPCAVPYDAETRQQWTNLIVPLDEYRQRLDAVRSQMEAMEFDALLVVGNREDSASVAYLTNYRPHGGTALLLVPSSGEPVLVFDYILHGEPMHSMIWDAIVDDVRPASRASGMLPGTVAELAAEAITEMGLDEATIGVASLSNLPMSVGTELQRLAPGVTWQEGAMAVLRPRAIKSEREIEFFRRACRITRRALEAGAAACEPGTSEDEVASIIHATMMAEGADMIGFETAVSSGPRAGIKHADPTARVMQPGDMVFLDCGAVIGGYHADLSRTLAVRQSGSDEQAMLDTAVDMFRECLKVIRPGAPVRDIYRAAERVARRAGFSTDYMPNGLGHGLGLSLFEMPFLGPTDDSLLEEGMIFALEPMLVRYGVGTAVVEESVLVTADGVEVLSGAEWEIGIRE
ncbi:Xaa-Pro dipeptidase [soil metagenome]